MLLKEKYPDSILLYRLGDFYEMFFEDALLISEQLELTLTGRDCGLEEKAPMCGVPHHAVDIYINKMLKLGHKVALCEQMTDPSESKGIVERDVVRIITPGTVINNELLTEDSNNYILSLYKNEDNIGISYCDVSTGEFYITQISGNLVSRLTDELVRLQPGEVIANSEMIIMLESNPMFKKLLGFNPSFADDDSFEIKKCTDTLSKHFISESRIFKGTFGYAICAGGALLTYLSQTQMNSLSHINKIIDYNLEEFMLLDASTRRNLELTETLRQKSKKGSLLWTIDNTATSMGSRLIKKWIQQPLQSKEKINLRLDAVSYLKDDSLLRQEFYDELRQVKDIQRLTTKITFNTITPRDCVALCESLASAPGVKVKLLKCKCTLLQVLGESTESLEDVHSLLTNSIKKSPPMTFKDGGVIADGYNKELDELRDISLNGKNMVSEIEISEREATGIKNLKIKYNKIFGYFIEVTKSNLDNVPYRYVRKQTLANSERYITQELKKLEDSILTAQDKIVKLETRIYSEVKDALSSQIQRLQKTASVTAELDVLQSLAAAAYKGNYCKPTFVDDGRIDISNGRHPVVEKSIGASLFVVNNTQLNMKDSRFLIITGPNMSGKSTYMRQVALITLMAHIGSFVPASSATIALTDRIFTRVGATDDLFMGQSTFMVEMIEVANILKNATPRSLLILDEIGRGTSTFDGLSIAWAVIEHICNPDIIGAKTLFATHYHELSELEGRVAGVKNYSIAVREHGEDIIFLHRIVRGNADKSFGVHVAKLAGLPDGVVKRAEEILFRLEQADINKEAINKSVEEMGNKINKPSDIKTVQMDMTAYLPYQDIIEEIKQLEIDTTTPIDALYILGRLKDKI